MWHVQGTVVASFSISTMIKKYWSVFTDSSKAVKPNSLSTQWPLFYVLVDIPCNHLFTNNTKFHDNLIMAVAVLAQLVERVDCRAGGRGFDSRGQTNTQGLKITKKWSHSLCSASSKTFAWLGWPHEMAVPPVFTWRRKIQRTTRENTS